jgi:hypothetical protein
MAPEFNTTEDLQNQLRRIEELMSHHVALEQQVAAQDSVWHLKKEVTVAHVLSTIGIVGLVLTSWFSLSASVAAIEMRTEKITDSRVSVVEAEVEASTEYMRENFRTINSSLAVINQKLDTLEERSIENRPRE